LIDEIELAAGRHRVENALILARAAEILLVLNRLTGFLVIIGKELEMQEHAADRREIAIEGQRLMDADAETALVVPIHQRVLHHLRFGRELAPPRPARKAEEALGLLDDITAAVDAVGNLPGHGIRRTVKGKRAHLAPGIHVDHRCCVPAHTETFEMGDQLRQRSFEASVVDEIFVRVDIQIPAVLAIPGKQGFAP
jgi:hypothetical protein